jgi:signal transduction histidine kinase
VDEGVTAIRRDGGCRPWRDAPSTAIVPAMRAATVVSRADVVPAVRRRSRLIAARAPAPRRRSWASLLIMTRTLGAVVAVALLAVHHVTRRDPVLIGLTVAWTAVSLRAFAGSDEWRRSRAAWALDGAAAIALVWLSGDWRSPFYVFGLTTLVLPVTSLEFRAAVAWGFAYTAAYLGVAVATELDTGTLRSSIRVETVATHLMVPIVITLALAYAAKLLQRLAAERERSERLAIQAERQRIAWELHDSAKQRVHAAHLVLSAAVASADGGVRAGIEHALRELGAAGADMHTSVAELRAPLDSRPVGALLRQRAKELEAAGDAPIEVSGDLGPLPPLVAVHAYRIASEAMTNAVRHSRTTRIEVRLAEGPGRRAIVVSDDGTGLPDGPRPGCHGLRTMRSRAESIGAVLRIAARADGRGTEVLLKLPPTGRPEAHA